MRRDDVIEQLRSLAPDVIIVIAYGKILPKAVLDIPKYGCLTSTARCCRNTAARLLSSTLSRTAKLKAA